MNTLFAITLLALVACTYGAPTPDRENALINQLDDGELLSLLDTAQAQEDTGKDGDDNVALLMALMQEDGDDENDIAQLEAMLQDARYQKWFHTVGKKLKSFGTKVYNGIKKVASNPIVKGIVKHAINKFSPIPIPIKAESQNDDDEGDIAKLEALLQDAETEGWGKKLKSLGKKVSSGAKKVASNPTVRKLAQKALEHYLQPAGIEADDDDIDLMLAMMQDEDGNDGTAEAEADDDDLAFLMSIIQDEDDEGITQLKAMMQDARFQGWFKSLGRKLKSFGKKVYSGVKKVGEKVYNGAKKVVSNPIVKGVLKHAINKISPIPIPIKAKLQNEDEEGDIALLMAMMQDEDGDDGIAIKVLEQYIPEESKAQEDKKMFELLELLDN